jgi:purine-binding chemotaxis protein CheW
MNAGQIAAGKKAGKETGKAMGKGMAMGGDWLSLARHAATGGAESEEPELIRELLTFRLAGTPYAIPVERVREIVRLREITPMPRVPDFVLGVVALRGEIVQVVDMRLRLGLEAREATRSNRIILLHGDEERVTGVLVDAVEQVMRVSEDQVLASSSGEAGVVSELCTSGEEFVSLVDMDRVLDIVSDG